MTRIISCQHDLRATLCKGCAMFNAAETLGLPIIRLPLSRYEPSDLRGIPSIGGHQHDHV